MSQKANALKAFVQAKKNYAIESNWPHLNMVTARLLEEGAPVPTNANDSESVIHDCALRLLSECEIRFSSDEWPRFVRSCPLKPRPGVLPSVRVDDQEELESTVEEILTLMMSEDPSEKKMYPSGLVDPHGSIMVMPFIDATSSAVVSPRYYIMMGESNDGITAGGDGLKVAIPITHDKCAEQDLAHLNIDPNKIELEFVSMLRGKKETYEGRLHSASRSSNQYSHTNAIVQLRGCAGPRPIGTPPKGVTINGTFHGAERITVENIYICKDETEEELARLEEALHTYLPTLDNSVVVHYGGNHLSHHAGQCMDYGVPYIALKADDKPVQVGDKWTQAANGWVVLDMDESFEPQPYDPMDFKDAFIEGFVKGHGNFARQHGWLSNHFHQFIGGPINELDETAQLAGGYVAWLINASLSVATGEVRHITNSAHDFTLLPMATLMSIFKEEDWVEVELASGPNDRKHYYTMIERKPLTLDGVVSLFEMLEEVYKGNWGGGYGGAKYGESCKNARQLANAMGNFIKAPSNASFKTVLSHANATEHNVHNNGFFFNKFINETALHWGTDPKNVTISPKHFFSVYYAAKDLLDSTTHDNFHSIEDVMKAHWNTTLDDIPNLHAHPVLGGAVHFMHKGHYLRNFLHPRGKYSTKGSKEWIECGLECGECKDHISHSEYNKAKLDEQLKQSLTTGVVPYTTHIEAPFPKPQMSMDEEVLHLVKKLSKEDELCDQSIQNLALLVLNNWTPLADKYLALIVSKFNYDQLILFANTQKEMKE